MKIVYIAGLGHSGSTILDMALGCNPGIIGLGEISQTLKATRSELEENGSEFNKLLCSCGERINDCAFWKDAKKVLIDNSHLSKVEKYLKLIGHFKTTYGPDYILVDSSKISNEYLKVLNKSHNLKVIFLVRDFRSWCYSRHLEFGKNIISLAYQWARWTLGVLRFLKRNNFTYKTFGYEEFALYPDIMLKKMSSFIGVDYDPLMLCPENTQSHIIRGNAARGDKEKREWIRYDARWMTSLSVALYSAPLFPLIILNRRLVYSNFLTTRGKVFDRKKDDFLTFSVKKKKLMIKHTKGEE